MTSKYTLHGLSNFESKKLVENSLNAIPNIKVKVFLPDQIFIDSEKEIDPKIIQDELNKIGHFHLITKADAIPQHIKDNVSASGQYICPMFCEGETIHQEVGRCSVCNMFTVPVEQVDLSKIHQHQHQHEKPTFSNENAGKYYCPMMCEGDKVYDKMGSCPVCGMNLEKIPELKQKQLYTCPMHPQIVSDHPGNCSICGMDLVPMEPKDEVDETYLDLKKKFWISVALTVPIFILAMGEMIPGNPIGKFISPQISAYIQLFLCLPIVFYTAWTYFIRAYNSFKTRNLNMFSLIGLGATAAFIYSFVGLFFPNIFPDEFKTHHGMIGLYFESVAVILTLVILGQLMEAKAHAKTSQAIKELIKLTPNEATLIENGHERKVAVDTLKIGDHIRVKPGEKIPIDGKIIDGKSDIDESMITGEPIPVSKNTNDEVIGGSINGSGSFVMLTEKIGEETVLAKIIQMVNSASRTQAPIQRSVDKISKIFVPIVILVSIITFILWWIFGGENRLAFAITNSIAVLIVACPCALGLATPMSVMVAIGKGAKNGILIKNAEALERLNEINTLTIDKTGTITEGKPSLENWTTQNNFPKDEALKIASSLNKNSSHPLAKAFLEEAKKQNLESLNIQNFENIAGKGVSGEYKNQKILLGNLALLDVNNINTQEIHLTEHTESYLTIDGKLVATFEIFDPIKKTSKQAIETLTNDGINVIMLTGDNETTAKKVANEVNIKTYKAKVLPEDKLQTIKELQQKNKLVAMAGDGINDAPALAQANVAIAMDTGTDVAIESADITLLKGDLLGVVKSIHLSKAMMKNIKENLVFAFIYNLIGIPIAAGILYPFLGILMSPMIAAAAMSLSSVSVILNAARLNSVKLLK